MDEREEEVARFKKIIDATLFPARAGWLSILSLPCLDCRW